MIFGIIPISINFESIINQIENEVTEMDDLIKGVKIGKILTKDDEKKETKKIVAIVLAVIAAVAAVAALKKVHKPTHHQLNNKIL